MTTITETEPDTGHDRDLSPTLWRIPDRHSEDLFVGVRVEGFERQSAFRCRDGGGSKDTAGSACDGRAC